MKFIKQALITAALCFSSVANASFVNFDDYTFSSWGNQTKTGTQVVSDNGSTVTISGNRWVDILHGVTLTSSSILKFTIEATGLNAELYGIGFEIDDTYTYGSIDNFVFVGGTQIAKITRENPLTSFGSYASGDGAVDFTVDVGNYITGLFDRMVFVLDNDKNQSGSFVSFSNVQVCDNALVCQTLDFGSTTIPEPTHLGLLAMAFMVIYSSRRKKMI